MKIELQPQIEALLQAQVDAGLFGSVEEAVAAAVTAAFDEGTHEIDLSWAKPFIDKAEEDIRFGKVLAHDEVWNRVVSHRHSTS